MARNLSFETFRKIQPNFHHLGFRFNPITRKPAMENYYNVLEYIKENPDCSSFQISYTLDYNYTMVENILVDLEEQSLITKNVEYSEKPTEYMLYDKNSIDHIKQVLGEELTNIHPSINNSTVNEFLNHLAGRSSSEYTLAKDILGRRTKAKRQLIMRMINTILDYQQSGGDTYLGQNERFERSMTYLNLTG